MPYSYQNKRKTSDSFVPKRTTDYGKGLLLEDNRNQSIVQRKLKHRIDDATVVQLGRKKKKNHIIDLMKRPGFSADSKKSALLYNNLVKKPGYMINTKRPGLNKLNLAQPHRISWKDISKLNQKHQNGNSSGFNSMNKSFISAGKTRIKNLEQLQKNNPNNSGYKELVQRAKGSQKSFEKALNNYNNNQNDTKSQKEFLRQANSFHANVPDLGTHFGVNNPVSAAMHLNFRKSNDPNRLKKDSRARSPSPMSRVLLQNMDSNDISSGIAVDKNNDYITTDGEVVKRSQLSNDVQKNVKKFKFKTIGSFDKNAISGPGYTKMTGKGKTKGKYVKKAFKKKVTKAKKTKGVNKKK